MSEVPRVFIEATIDAYAARRGDAWLREAQVLAVECSDRWIPHLVQFPEVEDAMDLVLLIAEAGATPESRYERARKPEVIR